MYQSTENRYRQAAHKVALRNSKFMLPLRLWILFLRPRLSCRNPLLLTMFAESNSILVLTEAKKGGISVKGFWMLPR